MDSAATRRPPNGVSFRREARAWLILGRVSNLPTVWSNCLAGWLFGGAGEWTTLALLCAGVSCLYVAGMFLNDAADVAFDIEHSPERPIPSGAVSRRSVVAAGAAMLIGGLLILSFVGSSTMLWGSALSALIIIYDVTHKAFAFAPVIMGACRFAVYPLAASAGLANRQDVALASGIALGCYVAGISFFARAERTHRLRSLWPLALMLMSAVVAVGVNFRFVALLYLALFLIWIALAARLVRSATTRAVSMLLAGIVLFDLCAISPGSAATAATFALLFLLTLFLQRYIPAT